MSVFDSNGWYTKAVNYANGQYRSPNFGYPNTGDHGNVGRAAVVLHITDGVDSRAWLCSPTSNVSATFLIREEGIYHLVNIYDSPYANGIWETGHAWHGTPDTINPNRTTISIEREGHTAFPVSARIDALTVQLLADLQEPFPQFSPYVPHQNLIGHAEISPLHRPNCPGPTVNFPKIAANANAVHPFDLWSLWGTAYPLDPLQRTWAIPTAWYRQAQQLGAAQSFEMWNPAGDACIQWFARGYIVYDKRTDRATVTVRAA